MATKATPPPVDSLNVHMEPPMTSLQATPSAPGSARTGAIGSAVTGPNPAGTHVRKIPSTGGNVV